MSNFLSTNETDGLPYIQWGSDAVQWSKKEGDSNVPFTFDKAIMDVENLKVGWIKIAIGVYDAILDHYQKPPLPRPEEKTEKNGKEVYAYNKGFAVTVLFPEGFGEERLFSWSTSQKGSLEAMSEILDAYEAGKAANLGKLPVVQFKGHLNKKFGKGSSNIPKFEIVQWVERPGTLKEGGSTSAPPQTTATAQPDAAPAETVSEF